MGWGLSVEKLAELHRRAAEMRRNPTEPEKRLWRHLSNSQLNGHKFRRQSVIGWFIADFLCPQKALIVEVDGDTHDEAKDRLRDDVLARRGFCVLRVTNDDVMTNMDGVLTLISGAIAAAGERWHKPHPNPSPEGEGLEQDQLHPSPSGEGTGVGAVASHASKPASNVGEPGMIQIFIDTKCGKVSDHYQFAAVPRVGEIVFILQESGEIKLRVNVVEHYPPSKEDVMDALSPVTIQCEVID